MRNWKKLYIIVTCSIIISNILLILIAINRVNNNVYISQYGEFEYLEIRYGYKRAKEMSVQRKERSRELNLALKIRDQIKARKKDDNLEDAGVQTIGTTSKKRITTEPKLITKFDTTEILFAVAETSKIENFTDCRQTFSCNFIKS